MRFYSKPSKIYFNLKMEAPNNATEAKQNFLRCEILDKGYDANDFVEYLIGFKGEDAGNVENWTMEELFKIVHDYRDLRISMSANKISITPENYSTGNYEEIIICNKQDKTPISDCHNIEIIISE
jgi:hypothetical protein